MDSDLLLNSVKITFMCCLSLNIILLAFKVPSQPSSDVSSLRTVAYPPNGSAPLIGVVHVNQMRMISEDITKGLLFRGASQSNVRNANASGII